MSWRLTLTARLTLLYSAVSLAVLCGLGALVMRAIFIFAGSALISKFTVTLAVFGVILLYTAYKLAFQEETEVDPEKSMVLRAVRPSSRRIEPMRATDSPSPCSARPRTVSGPRSTAVAAASMSSLLAGTASGS